MCWLVLFLYDDRILIYMTREVKLMMHEYEYNTCIEYDTYPIRWYIYFKNNRIWYV